MWCYFRALSHTTALFFGSIRGFFRLLGGAWVLSQMEAPIISIFGGSKIDQSHPYAKKATMLAKMLLDHGYSVVTGGGPGIMQAANCGLFKNKNSNTRGKSIGIEVEGLAEKANQCADIFIVTRYFSSRKYLLTHYSNAFVVFPGGYGTADELFEVLTLMQTDNLHRLPVILIGISYWKPLMDWVHLATEQKLLLEEDAKLLFVTDDIDEAVAHVQRHCKDHLFHQN